MRIDTVSRFPPKTGRMVQEFDPYEIKDGGGIGPSAPDRGVTPRYITKESLVTSAVAPSRNSLTISRVFSEIEFLDHTPSHHERIEQTSMRLDFEAAGISLILDDNFLKNE